MQKLKLLKNWQQQSKGNIIKVENNIAHGLIDRGIAKLYASEAETQIKDMGPKRKEGYRTADLRAGKAKKYETK